jgi:hypothetical protein
MKALDKCAKPVLAGFDTLGSFWNADVNQNTVLTALKDNDLNSLYGELIRVLMDQDFYGDWIAMGLGDDAGQMQQLTTLPNALLRYKEKPLGISGLLKEISSDPNYTAWGGRATFDYIKSRDLQNYADTWDRLTSLHHCIKQTKPDPTPGPTPPPTPGTEWNCTNEEGGIVSMSAKLTSEALGNEFRAWVLKDPARAEALKDIYTRLGYSSTVLSPTGDHTNKWIGQAWKKYGCEYSKEEKEPRLPDDDTDTEPVTEGEVVCTTGDIVDETDLSDVVRSPVSGGKIGLYNGEAYFQLEKGSFSEGKDVSGKYVSLKCRDNITDGRYPNFLNHKEQRALVKTQKGPGKGQDRRRIRRQVRQDRRARRRKRRT